MLDDAGVEEATILQAAHDDGNHGKHRRPEK